MRKISIGLLGVVGACALGLWSDPDTALADSIILKNGTTFHGSAETKDGQVIVTFGEKGRLSFPASTVQEIVEDDNNTDLEGSAAARDEPTGKPVLVKLRGGASGPYRGWTRNSSDDRVLVLELPESGEVKILRDTIESIEPLDEAELVDKTPAPAPGSTVKTTHLVYLKNGRKLRGNAVQGPESEDLVIEVPGLGKTRIPRKEIDRVERAEGEIKISPEPVIESVTEPTPPSEGQLREALRRELREELLREILDEWLERRLAGDRDLSLRSLDLDSIRRELSPTAQKEARHYVYELGRQRTTNRVRAEGYLRRLGTASLPYLSAAVRHPFELTRRAAQRLLRDIDDVRGVPLAIEGLADEDRWVRELAHQALESLLRGTDIRYHPRAKAAVRKRAIGEYRQLWRDLETTWLRDHLAQSF